VAPLLSIITVNLNDRVGLARTLDSVARQTFTDRELIVVDGGSTDGSADVVRERGTLVTGFVSEPDRGIFDAQNKGTRRAHGTYCLYLNAGDLLASDDALERFFGAGPAVEDILYGDVVIEEVDGRRRVERSPERLTWAFFMRTTLPHQSTAFKRDLFDRVGPYDTTLRVAGDYEFFLRSVVVHGASSRHVPVPLAVYVMGGRSTRPEAFPLVRRERVLAKEKALSPVLREHWEEYLVAKRGRLLHWLRVALRPLSRPARTFSRRLRRRPDSPI
jgi:glycosyltransferase involved in cell wall biosynthesis